MRTAMVASALAALVFLPAAALAQAGPGGPGGDGPPPEMRAKLDALDAQAKASSYAALSPDHRAKVQALVAKVVAGSVDPRDAAAQIDALLTPDEAKAVLGVATATRAQMRAAFGAPPAPPAGGAAPGGPPPPDPAGPPPGAGGPPAGADGPPAGRYGRRAPTAGGYLLRVSLTPQQQRALRGGGRSPGPPGPPN